MQHAEKAIEEEPFDFLDNALLKLLKSDIRHLPRGCCLDRLYTDMQIRLPDTGRLPKMEVSCFLRLP